MPFISMVNGGSFTHVNPGTSKIMTVSINFSESNPTKMCTYADDAVGAPCGLNDEATAFWQEFFGYRPCLFKDGAIVGYLNPNDYTKFEDGSTADITSGNSGDVMIEYPRRGVKMSKSGNVVTISVTDEPDADGYTYYAHTRGTTRKEVFYLGAYLAAVVDSKLRSLSGKEYADIHLTTHRSYAKNLGSEYTAFPYYQFLYIQIMYCFQFANDMNSQRILGRGVCNANIKTSGTANAKGLVFGTPDTTGELKLFGLENPWGMCSQVLDGYICNQYGYIYTATDGFNDTGTGYTSCGYAYFIDTSGYITSIYGTDQLGFTPLSGSGSSTTYLCDEGDFTKGNKIPDIWGYANNNDTFGIFRFHCCYAPTSTHNTTDASRLAYL